MCNATKRFPHAHSVRLRERFERYFWYLRGTFANLPSQPSAWPVFLTFHPPRLPVMAALSSVGDRLSVALALKSGALGADAPALIAALPEELAALRAAVVDDS